MAIYAVNTENRYSRVSKQASRGMTWKELFQSCLITLVLGMLIRLSISSFPRSASPPGTCATLHLYIDTAIYLARLRLAATRCLGVSFPRLSGELYPRRCITLDACGHHRVGFRRPEISLPSASVDSSKKEGLSFRLGVPPRRRARFQK